MADEHDEPPNPNEGTPPDTSESTMSAGPFGRHNPDPGDVYRAAFTPGFKAELVDAIQYAYEIVQEHHFPKLGFNAHTFGHCVYHVGCFQLEQRMPGQLERVAELRMLARFQSGEYTLGFYKVGNSAKDNIWAAFPTSENGAMSVSDEGQPILAGLEEAMLDQVDSLRYAVVAHLGNAQDGLCALYLCIPIEAAGGKIIRWGFAEELYVADRGVGTPNAAPGTPPAEERAAPPQLDEVPEGAVIVSPKDST